MPYKAIKKYKSGTFLCKEFPSIQQKALKFKNVVRTNVHKLNGKPFYSWRQNKEDKTWERVPMENADGDLLGVVEGEDEFEYYYTVELPEIDGEGRVWIPIAQSDPFQTIEILSLNVPTKEQYLTDDQFNNKSLYLELDESHSHKEISIAYRVKRLEKNPYPAEDGESLEQYLKSNTLIPVDDRFKEIELSFLMGELLILILDQLLGILILWLTLLWRLMNLSLDQKRLLLLKER